jgi:hypothetical protein
MATLRERLPRPPTPEGPLRLLGEDFRFTPELIPSTRAFHVEHQTVQLLESPLALERTYRLRDPGDVGLVLGFRLCWYGGADALESLFAFTESFQRDVPADTVRRVSDEGIGEFGVAWSWDDPLGAEVVAFVVANVLVTVQAYDAAGLAERVARELSGQLRGLRTIDAYVEAALGVFEPIRRQQAGPLQVAAGQALALGAQPRGEQWFFITTKGSANRDSRAPDHWYYRAGLKPGPAEIQLYRVDPGLLPVLERLDLEIR